MSAQASELVPVLDQMAEFTEDALKLSSQQTAKIAELEAKLAKLTAEQEKIVLEKVATARATFFDVAALETALARLEGMGIIDANAHVKLANRIKDDPNMVIPLMTKVAESLMSAPGEGAGIDKEAGSMNLNVDSEDPDGWVAMAQGRPVQIKQ
jgi:hypothetical protein